MREKGRVCTGERVSEEIENVRERERWREMCVKWVQQGNVGKKVKT